MSVAELGAEFWAWRVDTSFRSADDIPRLARDASWQPEFDVESVERRRRTLADFEQRWSALDVDDADVTTAVDHRLIGSALARVRWELDVMRSWERDALFQLEQVLGPYFDLLLRPPPFDEARQRGIIGRLVAVPDQLAVARDNLRRAGVRPLADAAVEQLASADRGLRTSVEALRPHFDPSIGSELVAAGQVADDALDTFRSWLAELSPSLAIDAAPGLDHFRWFLRNVALLPCEPDDLLALGRRELDRTTVWELVVDHRVRDARQPDLPSSAAAQVERQRRDERAMRAFCEREGILTHPDRLSNYYTAPMPAYLAPLSWLGVTNDLTDEHRLTSDALSYTVEPSPDLAYFAAANARDPRLGIVHEGAHYRQLALSWMNPNPLRRRYYDSVANEGIAHYNEELMLHAGLFDDAPTSHPVIYNFARLRALRVVVDIGLAVGELTLDEAIDVFMTDVGMDRQTAFVESTMYLSNPGLAMSYLVGKAEVLRLVADARRHFRDSFDLRAVHDHLYANGNVPLSLQRWELLGDRSDIDRLERADPG